MHEQLKNWADTTKVYPAIGSLYHLQQGNDKSVPKDIKKELVRWDVRGQFTWIEVRNLGKEGEENDAIYLNRGDAWHGAIVQTENNKTRDNRPPPDRLFCSEAVWQTYLVSCAKFRITPGRLRILVQNHVTNEETRMVIWQAARAVDENRVNQEPTDEKGYHVYKEPEKGFYALLGCTLGA